MYVIMLQFFAAIFQDIDKLHFGVVAEAMVCRTMELCEEDPGSELMCASKVFHDVVAKNRLYADFIDKNMLYQHNMVINMIYKHVVINIILYQTYLYIQTPQL